MEGDCEFCETIVDYREAKNCVARTVLARFVTGGYVLCYKDYNNVVTIGLDEIKYCPFCGRELK